MQARRVTVEIFINGKNITEDISRFIKNVSINEVLDGETNTAEIELEDRERLWIKNWFPQRGDSCTIKIKKQNWSVEGDEVWDFADWEIDEITNSFPPNVAKIKLNSLSNGANLKSVDKSRSWEKVKLSKICKDIADGAGLELVYDTDDDPEIARAEQKTESDLKFLHKLCKDKGLLLRTGEGQLIIFDCEKLESAAPVGTFTYGDQRLTRFSATATISEIYSAAHVTYSHGSKKKKIEHTFTDKDKKAGLTLQVNKKVNSPADAERLAKKALRDKNKEEIKIKIDCIGDFFYLAGNVIALDDTFGFYAGNYIIERADWKIGSGFTCSLDLRKCLKNY